ncbi:hypothetical protein Q1695_012552 [Nippostrongylus brasiliensis]|nr:hypothetical protein Q1695_012552 [Nippostrongylus brasiliensis]
MPRFRAVTITLLAFVVFATCEGDNVDAGGDLRDAFSSPFRVVGKRNQFYGLFKKLSYESAKPVYAYEFPALRP